MPSTEPRSEDEMLARTHRRAAELRHRRTRRRTAGAGLAAVLLVVAIGAVVIEAGRAREETTVFATDGTEVPPGPDAPPILEGWTPMAASPLSGRSGAVSAWTGSELLVWRGDGAFADVCTVVGGVTRCGEQAPADGAAYDPATDTWRMLPPAPVDQDQGDQLNYAGVWTGSELVVWGGPDGTGAAYDPASDAWRTIAAGPLVSGTRDTTMVWTGSEAIVLGPSQTKTDPVLGSGPGVAAYDPFTDRWRVLASSGTDGLDLAAVWCGGAVLVVDETVPSVEPAATAHRYDPSADRWTTIDGPPLAATSELVCGGQQVIAVGRGTGGTEPAPTGLAVPSPAAAILDLGANQWTLVDPPPVDASADSVLVWTGTEAVLVGVPRGEASGQPPLGAAILDPSAGAWRTTMPPDLSGRSDMAVVWADGELLVWGGAWGIGFTSEPAADGARYRPATSRPIPSAVLEDAERCQAERFASIGIDLEGSPEPGPTEGAAQDTLARDHAVTRWDLIEASADRRTWAGSSDGSVAVVFSIADDGTGWLVGAVRRCRD